MAVSYIEFRPPDTLRQLVVCGWTLTSDEPAAAHRVLPDGCMDIVVARGADAVIAGPWTKAFDAPMTAASFAAGIRFRPGAAPAVIGVAASELRDDHVPLADVWGPTGCAAPGDAPDAAIALDRLAVALGRRLPDAATPDAAVLAAAAMLARRPDATVDQIAQMTSISPRQLRRRFAEHVGYGPKRLARVLRLQRLLAAPADESWARRAVGAGYADQAHMTRECVALTGVSPTRLAA